MRQTKLARKLHDQSHSCNLLGCPARAIPMPERSHLASFLQTHHVGTFRKHYLTVGCLPLFDYACFRKQAPLLSLYRQSEPTTQRVYRAGEGAEISCEGVSETKIFSSLAYTGSLKGPLNFILLATLLDNLKPFRSEKRHPTTLAPASNSKMEGRKPAERGRV